MEREIEKGRGKREREVCVCVCVRPGFLYDHHSGIRSHEVSGLPQSPAHPINHPRTGPCGYLSV